jgi:2-polyprenyl-3-methyl-5-hydroxy-6-metoxy-1,4-benzoquinol methylase
MKTFATASRPEPAARKACALCGHGAFSPLWRLEGYSFVRCRTCGLIQQNPQPLAQAVLRRYGQDYLDYEVARQFEYRDLELLALADLRFEERARPLVEEARREGRAPAILDVGCATGALLAHFRDSGWLATGVEACAESAAYGRDRFGLDIRPTTLEAADLGASRFDVVHASHLIEHLNDPAGFLARIRGLLRPGGLLFLTTPNADGFQARLLGKAWRSAINDHLYLFSARTLRSMLERSGFRVDGLVTWGGWAKGLPLSFLKPPLDRAAKKRGYGDVMACVASCGPDEGAGRSAP